MVPQRERRPFVPRNAPDNRSASASTRQGGAGRASQRSASQVIPDRVANRMARRIALATGVPTVMGMAVFVGSYLLVSRHLLDVPPSATLLASGACFLLGLVGLSYGVLSASWEEEPGSLVGIEQIGLNLGRVRASIQAMRRGSREDGPA
ncbi:MAG: PAM68 family protein [Cyanobacteriota bacterium]|nr:PAM68 family protein [Cyanobacteriota bacterium]